MLYMFSLAKALRVHLATRAKRWGLSKADYVQALIVADAYGCPIEEAVLRVKGRMPGILQAQCPRAKLN